MEIYETQPERTDLPLVVMPVIIESMIEPFEKNFELLKDIARVRMYKDFTLDEDTIVERCAEADAIMVIGFHCADSILDRLNAKCYAFGGTGVASYIDLDKAKERGIRVCNVVHYGDHAVAEHTIALLMELARQVGKLDRQVKTGDWDGADGYELYGKKLGIIGLGGIGQTVARIAGALGMNVSAWNSHVPEQVFADLNITPVNDMNELIAGSDVVSIHMPLLDSTKGIVTAENLEALKPGTMFINTARAEIIEPGAL
ncbi:D-2-hydroxyacid dehydrogenase family protein, partial [Bifidobacterium dentium]